MQPPYTPRERSLFLWAASLSTFEKIQLFRVRSSWADLIESHPELFSTLAIKTPFKGCWHRRVNNEDIVRCTSLAMGLLRRIELENLDITNECLTLLSQQKLLCHISMIDCNYVELSSLTDTLFPSSGKGRLPKLKSMHVRGCKELCDGEDVLVQLNKMKAHGITSLDLFECEKCLRATDAKGIPCQDPDCATFDTMDEFDNVCDECADTVSCDDCGKWVCNSIIRGRSNKTEDAWYENHPGECEDIKHCDGCDGDYCGDCREVDDCHACSNMPERVESGYKLSSTKAFCSAEECSSHWCRCNACGKKECYKSFTGFNTREKVVIPCNNCDANFCNGFRWSCGGLHYCGVCEEGFGCQVCMEGEEIKCAKCDMIVCKECTAEHMEEKHSGEDAGTCTTHTGHSL